MVMESMWRDPCIILDVAFVCLQVCGQTSAQGRTPCVQAQVREYVPTMRITPAIFDAFLKCATKCHLRSLGEVGSGNEYAEWVRARDESYRGEATRRLQEAVPEIERVVAPLATENLKAAKWGLAVDLTLQIPYRPAHSQVREASPNEETTELGGPCSEQLLESRLHAIERVPPEGRGKPAQFVPIRFVFRNKLTKEDRLLLAFDALVLSEVLGRAVSLGKIIHGDDHATLKVKTSALAAEVRKRLEKLAVLLSSPAPPDLVLNRHCAECEFQPRCRKIAVEKDDLSLLARMTAKERQELRSKGIFTITQLSYTFRPRRRPKKQRDKREKYHHSLKALAIREKKIHIVGSPELKIDGTPVYFDVEGLPDRDFYYLIGMRIGDGDSAVQHSLWADTVEDEGKIWREFLALLETVERPVLIHYGSYETIFLKQMCERFGEPPEGSGTANAVKLALNLLSIIFAQFSFTTFSNGLKEIAGQLGYRWSAPADSGVQTIRWRTEWETSKMPLQKETLLTYNANDCEALEIVVKKLVELCQPINQSTDLFQNDVVHTAKLKWEHPHGFKRNSFLSPELDTINRAAYWNYQRARIYVKTNRRLKDALRPRHYQRPIATINKTIEQPGAQYCPKCYSPHITKMGSKCTKIVKDIKFMRSGIKRWIVRYRFSRYYCATCGISFLPPNRPWSGRRYGSEIIAFCVYM